MKREKTEINYKSLSEILWGKVYRHYTEKGQIEISIFYIDSYLERMVTDVEWDLWKNMIKSRVLNILVKENKLTRYARGKYKIHFSQRKA